MDRIKSYDDDDMNNFAFEKADAENESDEELLDEWSTEGPDDEPAALVEEDAPPTAETGESDGEEAEELDPFADDALSEDDPEADEEDDKEEW